MIFLIILLYFILGILVTKATIWLLTEGNPSSFVNEFDDEIDCIGTTFFLIVFFPVVLTVMVLLILGIVGYSFVIGFGGNNPLNEYIEAVKENLEKRKEK
jgi:low temperature requirement protein LtrA